MIIQKGIKRIVYPKFPITACQDKADLQAADLMLNHHSEVVVSEVDCIDDIFKMFDITKFYMDNKLRGD